MNASSNRTYRAWLVDLDGTLYRARWVKVMMALELGLGHWGAIPTLRAFRREQERMRRDGYDGEESPFAAQIARAGERLGATVADVERVVGEWMFRRPGKWLRRFRRESLVGEIAAFRAAGGQTALVSDYPAREKLSAMEATELFHTVVANGEDREVRRLKPAPDGMLLAAQRLGVSPGECLVIGDREDADGAAARAAGMAFRLV
jgi:phosphoglycolate phosphatase/putative hydrolase of the HAD superfamily